MVLLLEGVQKIKYLVHGKGGGNYGCFADITKARLGLFILMTRS